MTWVYGSHMGGKMQKNAQQYSGYKLITIIHTIVPDC